MTKGILSNKFKVDNITLFICLPVASVCVHFVFTVRGNSIVLRKQNSLVSITIRHLVLLNSILFSTNHFNNGWIIYCFLFLFSLLQIQVFQPPWLLEEEHEGPLHNCDLLFYPELLIFVLWTSKCLNFSQFVIHLSIYHGRIINVS